MRRVLWSGPPAHGKVGKISARLGSAEDLPILVSNRDLARGIAVYDLRLSVTLHIHNLDVPHIAIQLLPLKRAPTIKPSDSAVTVKTHDKIQNSIPVEVARGHVVHP